MHDRFDLFATEEANKFETQLLRYVDIHTGHARLWNVAGNPSKKACHDYEVGFAAFDEKRLSSLPIARLSAAVGKLRGLRNQAGEVPFEIVNHRTSRGRRGASDDAVELARSRSEMAYHSAAGLPGSASRRVAHIQAIQWRQEAGQARLPYPGDPGGTIAPPSRLAIALSGLTHLSPGRTSRPQSPCSYQSSPSNSAGC